MNWERELIIYYDQMKHRAGEYQTDKYGRSFALLPIRHTCVSANLEIFIDLDGNFQKVELVPLEDAFTITGTTEDAIARSSNQAAHLVCDTLEYMAGDILEFFTRISASGSDKSMTTKLKHEVCVKQLEEASSHEDAPESLKAICAYVKKDTMIHDILSDGREEITGVICKGSSFKSDAKVRFRVLGAKTEETWKDKGMFGFWILFCTEKEEKEAKINSIFTGESQTQCRKTATGVISDSDSSKLFSSNIPEAFTGRFITPSDFATIGRDDDAKIYAALKYLLKTAGRNFESYFLVTWDSQQEACTGWMRDTSEFFNNEAKKTEQLETEEISVDNYLDGITQVHSSGMAEAAQEQKQFLTRIDEMITCASEKETRQTNNPPSKIYVMGLRKNYPGKSKGRISVVDFQELSESTYLKNIRKWQTEGYWRQLKKYKSGYIGSFYGMPSISDMANLLYGQYDKRGLQVIHGKDSNIDVSFFYQRIARCILYGERIPIPLVELAASRASNPLFFKNRLDYERVLSLACAFIAKNRKSGDEPMLNEDNKDRSYLFGRLMAVADRVERQTFDSVNDARRRTNAEKNMRNLPNRPGRVWQDVSGRIIPYFEKLDYPERRYYEKLINTITDMFTPEDFSNKPLTHMYLLGYSAQTMNFFKKKKTETILEHK